MLTARQVDRNLLGHRLGLSRTEIGDIEGSCVRGASHGTLTLPMLLIERNPPIDQDERNAISFPVIADAR